MNKENYINYICKNTIYNIEQLKKMPDDILEHLYLRELYRIEGTTGINKHFDNYLYFPNKIIDNKSTLYDNYLNANNDNLNGTALLSIEDGRNIKHNELIQIINSAACGLTEFGIGNNSKIGVMVNGTYEEPVTLLAPNKLGALVKYIDFTKNIAEIRNDINNASLDMLFMDKIFLPMESIINEKKLPVIVLNSNQEFNNSNCITFQKLLKIGSNSNIINAMYVDNKPTLIINSSGTTGIPKPIVHSDSTVNSAVQKLMYTNYPMDRNNIMLKVIPAHIGLGLITSLYSSLISGTSVVQITANNPMESISKTVGFLKDYKKIIKSNSFNTNSKILLFAAPMFYRAIYEGLDQIDDLSSIGALLAAGSKMTKEELDIMNKKFEQKNCNIPICNGYGQNEQCGAVTLNSNLHNINGSAGFPVIGTDIKIVNPDTLKEVKPGETGKIIEKSSSLFLGYYGQEEKTKASKITLSDGSIWFDTNDLGYFDNNGYLYINGRISRVLIRYDCKLSIDHIEEKIKNHYAVDECIVMGIEYSGENDVPIAFVKINDNYSDISMDIVMNDIQNSEQKLGDLEMPIHFEIIQNIPYKNNGKIDYKYFEEQSQKIMSKKIKKLVK